MNELYPYYERELAFVREMAAEFAARHPDVAARLDLSRFECADPHVERLIEAFALLAARIHYRLDSDYPEFTQSLVEILYPNFLRPVPSFAVAQFALAPGGSSDAAVIDRGQIVTPTKSKKPGNGGLGEDESASETECQFRTCYPVRLLPICVEDAEYALPEWAAAMGHAAGIRLRLSCQSGFSALQQIPAFHEDDSFRLFLRGTGHVPYTLYEVLVSKCEGIVLRDPDSDASLVEMGPEAVQPLGFEQHESLLPAEKQIFHGFRLLQEYISFPEKFLFIDLLGLRRIAGAGFGHVVDVLFLLNKEAVEIEQRHILRGALSADNFQPHCTPIVNLFERRISVPVDQRRSEYLVEVDPRRKTDTEVYSISSVSSVDPVTGRRRFYNPLQAAQTRNPDPAASVFWRVSRRPSSQRGDSGTDVFLSFTDLGAQPSLQQDEILRVQATCSNRNLPSVLPVRYEFGELQPSSEALLCRFLRRPTPPARINLKTGLEWKLISHLALSYLSFASDALASSDDQSGRDSLRSMLSLYNFSDDPSIRRQIEGIVDVSCKPAGVRVLRPKGRPGPPVMLNGYALEVEFSEDAFRANGFFVLASVLDRFFGLTAGVNSFVQMTANTDGRRRFQWAPRAGEQLLR